MKNKLSVLSIAVLATLTNASHAESITVPATVSVDNTIDFQNTSSLDFGIVRAKSDVTAATNCAGIVMPANPTSALTSGLSGASATACTATGDAVLQNVGGTPTRANFTVAGLSAFTELNLTLPSGAVDLALNPAPENAAKFQLNDFTAYQTSGSTPAAVTTTVRANSTGDIAFSVGATMITDPGTTATSDYEDTIYEGSFDVEVAY